MVHSYSVRLVPRPLPARPSLLPTPHHPVRADVRRTWLTVTRCGSTLARCPLAPRSYPPRTTPFGPTFVGHGSQLLGAARPSPAARSSLAPTCGAMKSCNTLSMSDLRVSEIWRYPIKSVGGERVSVATVTELGVLGDRSWGIFDVDTGTVLTARRTPELLFASAALTGADVAITLPDGTVISSANETCNQQLSVVARPARSNSVPPARRAAPTRSRSTLRTTRTGSAGKARAERGTTRKRAGCRW